MRVLSSASEISSAGEDQTPYGQSKYLPALLDSPTIMEQCADKKIPRRSPNPATVI